MAEALLETDFAARSVYRQAIDPNATDSEGEDWWAAVVAEVRAVIAAPDLRSAATLITWWHPDWSAVGDTPEQAARRLRAAAASRRRSITSSSVKSG